MLSHPIQANTRAGVHQGAAAKRERLPRYRRSPSPPPVHLTARDLRVLRHISRMRFLDRDQVQRLEFTPAGATSCKRRLTLLYHNGYLDRAFVPVGAPCGSSRALYCLDRLGEEALAHEDGADPGDLKSRREREARKVFFLTHLAETNDVWVATIDSCRKRNWPLDWTDERQLRRDLAGVKLGARSGATDLLAPIPDGHFAVDAGGQRYGFALELDRGTVEEKRMRRRFQAYGEWALSGDYAARFGPARPRVLFVVSGDSPRAARIERLKAWCEAEGGRSLFWFADHGAVTRSDVLRDAVWQVAGLTDRRVLLPGSGRPVVRASGRALPSVRQ